mgnify:FL=1
MGYEVRFRAFSYEDEVFLSLRFLAEDPAGAAEAADGAAEGPLVRVLFYLDGNETAAEETDILPVGEGEERVVRTRMSPEGKPESARAEVSIGEESIVLETDIRPEQE